MLPFAVVLAEPYPDIIASLKNKYPDYHEFSSTVFLVASGGTSQEVAQQIGLDGTKQVVVFRLVENLSGYAYNETADWLSHHMGQPA